MGSTLRKLVVLSWLLSAVAFAQSLAEAQRLYADGDLAAALKTADAALKGMGDVGGASKLQVVRGLALHALGKKDKARAAFVLALESDPTATLDPQRDPPAAITLFEQATAGVPPGTVSVSTTGTQKSLRIDGVDFGPLPLTTKLAIGRHTLEARAADGGVTRSEVVVKSGEQQAVELLAPPPPEEPPVATTAPPLPFEATQRSASLLQTPTGPLKTTWWGLIPIGVATTGSWTGPVFFRARAVEPGMVIELGAVALIGLGVAMISCSSVLADVSKGRSPRMEWWGVIPLGLGAAAAVVMVATMPGLALPGSDAVAPANVISAAIAPIGLGIGAGMLVGRALGLSPAAPQVSFFALPQGGGGLVVGGRFP